VQARPLRLALVLLALCFAACAGRVWNVRQLAERHPALTDHPGHRLAEIHPYVLPRAGAVWLFTCRWSTDVPIGVWLSADFDDDERHGVRVALEAWQRARLGVRFVEVREDEASIRIGLREETEEVGSALGAGRAVVDCLLDGSPEISDRVGALPAQLVRARVELSRLGRDALGRPKRHTPEEFAGAALHELGHALGFQGHASFGATALRREPERVRALGAKVLAGEPFADASLAALYALPSGCVLAMSPVSRVRTELVDRMAALAERGRLAGPFVRVGDTAARVFWSERREPHHEYGLAVVNLSETYADPTRVLVVAENRTRGALPRSRDRAP